LRQPAIAFRIDARASTDKQSRSGNRLSNEATSSSHLRANWPPAEVQASGGSDSDVSEVLPSPAKTAATTASRSFGSVIRPECEYFSACGDKATITQVRPEAIAGTLFPAIQFMKENVRLSRFEYPIKT
jgi:hypothetical protein